MHAKTDSEPTSLVASSPECHRGPEYYVQSPSHDGDNKTTTSFNSTPIISSPLGSPRHSSGGGGDSRESSTSRCSGPLKPASRKAPSYDAGSVGGRAARRQDGFTNWEFDLMEEEEGFCEDENRLPPLCYFLAFFLGFFLLFSLFSLILWGVSTTQKPKLTMQSIKFESFIIQAGTDNSGVSTDMISLNSTLKFHYKNEATFFGVHVSSTPVSLSYTQIQIGYGDVEEFYKKRKQEERVMVVVAGDKIPMYGSGGSLTTPTGMTDDPVPLELEFAVETRGHVLGRLVKHKFYNKVECLFNFTVTKMDVPISLKNCNYDRS